MISGTPINLQPVYKLGEKTLVFIPIDDAAQQYVMTVYAEESDKYLDEEGKYSDISVQIPLVNDTLLLHGDVIRVEINTYYLTNPDFITVQVVNLNDATDSIDFSFQAGYFYAYAPDMILVYGYLHDARGLPIRNEPITFTVMNSASYFDNSPLTSMTATALTDDQGRFEIKLNRAYDYLLTVNRLNYTKVIKLSEVDYTVSAVEVIIGRGLVCDGS